MVEFTKKWEIELKCTASENPWGNGKCEKVVGLLKERNDEEIKGGGGKEKKKFGLK